MSYKDAANFAAVLAEKCRTTYFVYRKDSGEYDVMAGEVYWANAGASMNSNMIVLEVVR